MGVEAPILDGEVVRGVVGKLIQPLRIRLAKAAHQPIGGGAVGRRHQQKSDVTMDGKGGHAVVETKQPIHARAVEQRAAQIAAPVVGGKPCRHNQRKAAAKVACRLMAELSTAR